MIEPIGRGVLDRPLSRAMTVEGVAHVNRDFNSLLAAPSRPSDASTSTLCNQEGAMHENCTKP